MLLTPPLPPPPPLPLPSLSHASQRRLPFQGMSYRCLFFVSSPLSIFLFFLCFPSLSSVSFHPGRPPKYSSVPELGSLTPTSPSSPVHPLPLPSPSSGDVSNDGGDGQFRGSEKPVTHSPIGPVDLSIIHTPRPPQTRPLVCLHVIVISHQLIFDSALQSEQCPVAHSIINNNNYSEHTLTSLWV